MALIDSCVCISVPIDKLHGPSPQLTNPGFWLSFLHIEQKEEVRKKNQLGDKQASI